MRFDILTLFPELFASVFGDSIVKRAVEAGRVEIHVHNIRDYAPGKHRVYLRWRGESLGLALVDPQGRVHDAEAADDDPDLSYFELGFASFASHVLTTTLTGTWSCRIASPGESAGPTHYAAYAVLDSPLMIQSALDQDWYKPGQPIALIARLTHGAEPLAGAEVWVEVYDPAHQATRLRLHDDGQHGDGAPNDGIYGARWVAPEGGGYLPFFVTAQGALGDAPFARGTEGVQGSRAG